MHRSFVLINWFRQTKQSQDATAACPSFASHSLNHLSPASCDKRTLARSLRSELIVSLIDRGKKQADDSSLSSLERARYEDDVYTWANEQIALLRRGDDNIDRLNIAEELSDVAGKEYDKLESALTIVLLHLLKWDYQPERRSRSWVNSIIEHRRRAEKQLRKNPGLESRLGEAVEDGDGYAITRCGTETDIEQEMLPRSCPYDWNEIMTREVTWPVRSSDR